MSFGPATAMTQMLRESTYYRERTISLAFNRAAFRRQAASPGEE